MDGINELNEFLAHHKPQLLMSGVPQLFWECLYRKVRSEIFDAGNAFSLLLIDYGDEIREEHSPVWTVCVSKDDGINVNDPNAIFLIDHAWTFRADQAKSQLEAMPQLTERMATIMGVDKDDENCTENLMKTLWKYCQSYSIQADGVAVEDRVPIWYIMDELGSGINHSDIPNFRVVPFLYIPTQTTYSILFPVESTDEGDVVSRDYLENQKDSKEREALLLPWKYVDFQNEDFTQCEPRSEYFIEGHILETYPEKCTDEPVVDNNRPLKVYSEYDVLTEALTDPAFEIVNNPEDADILWLATHFKQFNELSQSTPNKFVNQFPFEYVLTIKDLLSIVCRRNVVDQVNYENLRTSPKWLPTTYNLKTELVKFVSYYQNRAEKSFDNHWIIKPWNLARGLDTYITAHLPQITRLALTGPKIAQKYIENPVLFEREELGGKVKFDIRYVILLKDAGNLEAYIYSNFFLRFANKPFALTDFDEYEKHFTVMNYREESQLRHIRCIEFQDMWAQQYPEHPWSAVEENICDMLNEVLICATSKKPPCGIAPCKQSRALYAADIMLSWEDGKMQPKLLEVNWMPDCKRACDYYPDFYNDIFKLLFLNEPNDEVFRKISKTN